ncbi:hypothetical protein QTP86_027829, partial [Hemibagrus guttatus]
DEPDDSSPVSLSCEEQNEQRADEEKNEPSGKEAVGSSGRNVFARMLKAAQRYLADTSKQSTAKRRKSQSKQSQNASVSRKGPFTLQDGDGGATEDSSPMPLRRLRSGPVGRVARRRSGVQVQSTRGRSLQHRTPRTPNSSCTKPGRYEASVEIQETPHRISSHFLSSSFPRRIPSPGRTPLVHGIVVGSGPSLKIQESQLI